MKKSKAIIWGIILITAGLCWALSSLGILEVDIFFEGWWTLFIIVPCTISLFTSPDKISAAVGIVVGVLLLLSARGIINWDMIVKLVIPAIIVLIGIKLITNAFSGKKTEKIEQSLRDNAENLDNVFCIFTGEEVKCEGKVFRGAELNAIFGGIDYDLRGAVIEPDCAIKATAIFGGIAEAHIAFYPFFMLVFALALLGFTERVNRVSKEHSVDF